MAELKGLGEQVANTAAVASGAMSSNGHGNVSIRIPDSSEIVEEAARAAITDTAVGGPVAIEHDMRAAARQRAVAFGVAS